MVKQLIKQITPTFVLRWYHWLLARLGAVIYGHPSRRMIVIGVTGTKGKSTTANLIAAILEAAGFTVGLVSTVRFKIGPKVWANATKQTMPGRFRLQQLLAQMVRAGCRYAVVETSSEGIAQYRHLGIEYDVAVFTNLSPEHIESHGSFEQYRATKLKLFTELAQSYRKRIDGQAVKKVIVVNADDGAAERFLHPKVDEKWTFCHECASHACSFTERGFQAQAIHATPTGTVLRVAGAQIHLKLLGEFNAYNALAALTVGASQGVSLPVMQRALEAFSGLPGRMEEVPNTRGVRIFVDYAHEPASLEAVYKTIHSFHPGRIISVLGSQGGGRDKAKRPVLGKLAAQYTDQVIVTNEDPYDEDPAVIVNEVAAGAASVNPNKVEKIVDRRQALRRALEVAGSGDIVIVTGKGGETKMAVENGRLIDWSDITILSELLK